jgi:transcription initiation factor TFIIIB Brf1 subunit/transcription initiation factor TFIIB
LDLDEDNVELIKDRTILGLKFSSRGGTVEEMVGIEKDWDVETKKRYLRKEFQKWNNRISVLAAGEERDNAQKMLDRVAEARKLYD